MTRLTRDGGSLTRMQDSIPTLCRYGQVYLTAMEKAASLNSAFAEQCSAPAAPARPAQSIQDCQDVFSFDELTP